MKVWVTDYDLDSTTLVSVWGKQQLLFSAEENSHAGSAWLNNDRIFIVVDQFLQM